MAPVRVRLDDPITPQNQKDGPKDIIYYERYLEDEEKKKATTTTASGAPAYPPARPGAAPVPAPTQYIPKPAPEPTRTQPAVAQNLPPPPQPGAVPVPTAQQPPMTAPSTLPPPPKAGETLKQVPMPSQMQVPPPQQNYAPTHSTAGYIPPAAALQQPITPGVAPIHTQALPNSPPGYHQNTSAQEMTPAQRSSLEEQERKESVIGSLGGDSAGETAGNIWNAVKGWANTAGEKLAETEEMVWKRINER